MVLAAPQYAGPIGVPAIGIVRMPRELDRSLDRRPERSQPGIVSRGLPVTVGLHDVAELAVGAGAHVEAADAEREGDPERHAAGVRVLVVREVGRAHAAFELRGTGTAAPADSSRRACSCLRNSRS